MNGFKKTLLTASLICICVGPLHGFDETTPRRPGVLLYALDPDASDAQVLAAETVFNQYRDLDPARLPEVSDIAPVFDTFHMDLQATARTGAGVEESVAEELLATGAFAFVEPDYLVAPTAVPNDPSYGSQWHHAVMNCPDAWDITTGSSSVKLAVLDTGVLSTHPDLSDILSLPGKNTVDDSQNTEPNSTTAHFHGTHVAGCAAATGNNGTGVTGVAWDIRVVPVKISNRDDGQAYISDMAEGIQWAADQGVRVINLSYGGASSSTIDTAATYARNLGALMFMSAGNDNLDISAWSDWPSFVLVGSTTSGDAKSSFSNYGTPVDIVAPGSSILATTLQDNYAYASGTSMASPVCAGVAALVFSVDNTLTPAEVELILYSTADDLGAAGDDSVFGQGRVNAYAAVNAANNGGGGGSTPAAVTSPADNASLGGSSVTIQNDGGTGVTTMSLWVGTSLGASDLYAVSIGTSTSSNVTGLPTDGSTLYVRLWSKINGAWLYNDYTYTAASGGGGGSTKATVTNPSDNGTLGGASQTFTIDRGTNVTSIAIWLGSTAGSYNLGYATISSGTTYSATGLPTDGSTVHVTLWSQMSGSWESNAYTYTAASSGSGGTKAAITNPSDNATLSGASETFTIDRGTNVTAITIWFGSSAGAYDLGYASVPSGTSYNATGLPTDASTVHVTLYSQIDGAWQSNAYTYTAANGGGGSAKATITNPSNNGTLSGAAQSFTVDRGTNVSSIAIWFGTTANAYDIGYGTIPSGTNYNASGLPTDGSTVHVTLWSNISGSWQSNAYTYTAANGGGGAAKATITNPSNNGTLSGAAQTFTIDRGTNVTGISIWIGTSAGAYDLGYGTIPSGTSFNATGLPTDGSTVHVTLYSQISGAWQSNAYTYTAANGGGSAKATITNPSNNGTLGGASQTFTIDRGTNVSAISIWFGTSAGDYDLGYATVPSGTSYNATGLPTNGSTVHVTIWSYINGSWQSNAYSYTASGS